MNGRRTPFSRFGVVHHVDESGPLVWSWHIFYHPAVKTAEHLNRVRESTGHYYERRETPWVFSTLATVAYVDTAEHIDNERQHHAH